MNPFHWLAAVPRQQGVYYLSDPAPHADLELRHWRQRARHLRLFADEAARALPHVSPTHPHARHWHARADSLARLMAYLARQQRALTVLDVGCGLGWLGHHLAALPRVHVCGLDLNRRELTQAARVFAADQARLRFVYAEVFSAALPRRHFTTIVLADVLTYFPDTPALLRRLAELLAVSGEIHLLDTPLADRPRPPITHPLEPTRHHPTWADLAPFQPHTLYHPHSLRARLARWWNPDRAPSPHPWVRLTPNIQP